MKPTKIDIMTHCSQRRQKSVLWLFACVIIGCLSTTSTSYACSPPPIEVTVLASDMPGCVELFSPQWDDGLGIANHCDESFTLTYNQSIYEGEGTMEVTIQPDSKDWLYVARGRGVVIPWTSSDGDMGTIELDAVERAFDCDDVVYPFEGCDVSATTADPSMLAFAVLSVLALGRRRGVRGRKG